MQTHHNDVKLLYSNSCQFFPAIWFIPREMKQRMQHRHKNQRQMMTERRPTALYETTAYRQYLATAYQHILTICRQCEPACNKFAHVARSSYHKTFY